MEVAILLFVKLPVPGRVKSRLAAALGAPRASRLASALLVDRLVQIEEQFLDGGLCRILCGDQAGAERFDPYLQIASHIHLKANRIKMKHLAKNRAIWHYRNQGPGLLGDRIERIAKEFQSFGRIVLGTDILGQDPRVIQLAIDTVKSGAAVIEPADDGGFNLLGLPAGEPATGWDTLKVGFQGDDLPWRRLASAIDTAGWRLRILDQTPDIDDVADLESQIRRGMGDPSFLPENAQILGEVAKLPKDVWRDGIEMPILKARKPVPEAQPDKE